VFGEGRRVSAEVVMFEKEEEESVELVEAVEYAKEVTWGAIGQEG